VNEPPPTELVVQPDVARPQAQVGGTGSVASALLIPAAAWSNEYTICVLEDFYADRCDTATPGRIADEKQTAMLSDTYQSPRQD
jgi:hypothetical protein